VAESVAKMLGEGGRIAKKLGAYEVRPQQLDMAKAIAGLFEKGGQLLVEAGTGVGKSFAYLVPAIEHVLSHGGRVVISTHTIALQEQLVHKDIPFLQSIHPQPFSAVLVKGRSNYLSLRRLQRASQRRDVLFATREEVAELWRIEDWAYKTADGSLADLPQQPSPAVWDRAKSEHDDCMGRQCENYNKCFFQRARRQAQSAQILIVNHAMLFSDLALRLQNASILPDYDYLILDEAHTVENVAGDHLGITLADSQVRFLLAMLHNERTGRGILGEGKGASLIPTVHRAQQVAATYFGGLTDWQRRSSERSGRLRSPPPVEESVSPVLIELAEALREIREHLVDENDRLEFASYADRCRALSDTVDLWHLQKSQDWVYWMEVNEGARRKTVLCGRPIEVGAMLEEALYSRLKGLVLTSATLTASGADSFAYLKSRLNLQKAESVRLGSPFQYRDQMRVYVERSMPDPAATEEFTRAACEAVRKYVVLSEGRAFVLFTSYEMLRRCAEELADFLALQNMPLLVQGGGLPRSTMLERFRTIPRSVLFGTDTFWTGVDVPGDALSNVIIVKLPFAAPNHPVIEARMERIRAAGGNPFFDFQIPEAVLKFRQGIGRLIRTKTDRGIVVILDPRVVSKPYGRQFLNALPECPVEVLGQGAGPDGGGRG